MESTGRDCVDYQWGRYQFPRGLIETRSGKTTGEYVVGIAGFLDLRYRVALLLGAI